MLLISPKRTRRRGDAREVGGQIRGGTAAVGEGTPGTGGVETTGGGRCSTAALRVIKPSKYVYLSRMNLGFRQQPFGI